jgi:DNA processing protein
MSVMNRARVVTPRDDEWPAGFAELRDPPEFLTVRGVLPRGGIAVIGARDAEARMCAFARALAGRLGRPIVAGLAPGIDRAAHRGALDVGSPTVAYVGSGLERLEDPLLADAIVAGGGAVASEYAAGDEATRWSRIRRDRLQAAHAEAVVLIVSELDGGAMHTLRFARELGRPTFALEIDASGNAAALAAGASALPDDPGLASGRINSGFATDPPPSGSRRS